MSPNPLSLLMFRGGFKKPSARFSNAGIKLRALLNRECRVTVPSRDYSIAPE